jgi:hypothetical protein
VALRLNASGWCQPKSPEDGVPCIKADTYSKYGFKDRALTLLTELGEPERSCIPVRIRVVELLAEQGDVGGALQELRLVQPPDEAASEQIWTRISVLSGDEDDDELIDDEGEELVDEDEDEDLVDEDDDLIDEDDDLVDEDDDESDDEVVDEDELIDDDEDELTDPGIAPEVAIEDDPLDFGSDSSGQVFGSVGSDFGNIFGDQQDEVVVSRVESAQPMGSEGLSDTRAWIEVGEFEKALASLEGKHGLEADVWRAVGTRCSGSAKEAFSNLRDAMDEAHESDGFFPEALLELARLAALVGKDGAAQRTLRQLTNNHGGFRSREVAAIQRALELLREE